MLSRERLPSEKAAAIEFYARFLGAAARRGPEHLRLAKRWLCRNDLFYLLVVACKRKDMNHPWIFARCREIQNQPNGFLDLWAREHYKSTVITFGLSIQDILASHGDDPEPRYGGREVTIGILSFNNDTAADFLKQIKTELETNEELKALFPDVLWSEPKKNAKNWSVQGGITVKRKSNPKEATVEASGLVDGQPTGKHYFIRIYDDVVVPESVSTPDQILKTTQAWELSDNLGTEGGWERYIGTRYHLFDTYRVMAERGVPTRVYPCTSDGSEDFTKAVLKSPETLADKRRKQGPYTFGAQMLLNPTADRSQGFDSEWLKRWPATSTANLNIYILVDPASGRGRKGNDFTTMWVIGLSADGKVRVIDGVRDRLNLSDRRLVLFDLVKKWKPLGVFYEEVGIQADREHFQYVMAQENFDFTIHPISSQVPKAERIKRLIPVFEAGRILLPSNGIVRTSKEGLAYDVIRVFVEEEYTAFPVCSHDDALDCLAWVEDPAFKNLARVPMEQPEEEKPKWLQEMEDEAAIYTEGGFMAR